MQNITNPLPKAPPATTPESESYPLTLVQQEIWLDQMLHPDLPLYNIGGYMEISGPVDAGLFRMSLVRLIRENDALRTILHRESPFPAQEFTAKPETDIPFHDVSGHHESHQEAIRMMQKEMAEPFDLYGKLLFRYVLIKISENRYYWFNKYHHLIIDGWGISLCAKQLSAFYNELSGHPDREETVRFSYRNFIQDDQEYRTSRRYEKSKLYWQEKYRHIPNRQLTPFYDDHSMKSGMDRLCLEKSSYDQMRQFSRSQGGSVFHFILGALYVYFLNISTSGQDEFVIGLPTLNRSSRRFKNTVGLFSGIIPARFPFGAALNFQELVRSISRKLRQDYRHQRYPFGEILRYVKSGGQSIFRLPDIELSYEKHDYNIHFNGSPAKVITLFNGYERSALSIFVREYHPDENVIINISYNTGYFTTEEMELFKNRFHHLFRELLRHPQQAVRDVQIMPAEEMRLVLSEWNRTDADHDPDQCIPALFEEQAARTPDADALLCEGTRVTYRQLNRWANRIANQLIKGGTKPGTPVGICVERSPRMIASLLGILKAGGVCLLLDPTYPEDRLQYMAAEAGVQTIIMEKSGRKFFSDRKRLFLDNILENAESRILHAGRVGNCTFSISTGSAPSDIREEQNPVTANHPEDPACLIYTSGSTGNPKGVRLPHRQILNRLQWNWKTFPCEPGEVCCMKTPSGFVDSLLEIFAPLLKGIPAVIIRDADVQDVRRFVRILATYPIRQLLLVPSLLKSMLELFPDLKSRFPRLKYLICSGEVLPRKLVEEFYRRMPDTLLYNVYGASEAWDVTCHLCKADGKLPGVPIGRPITNMKTYITDEHLSPRPIGIPGILHVSGKGVALGYVGTAERSADKFIPDPFADDPEAILCKTGDIVRYLPDGTIDYIGRKDHQIKIRGMRVEPGEIESVLMQHTDVKEAVVIGRESNEDQSVAAYVVFHSASAGSSVSDVKNFLKKKLPPYMVPSSIIAVDTLPLNSSGKIDRGRLSEIVPAATETVTDFVAPGNQTEQELVLLWEKYLEYRPIGIRNNFFDIGGHSLLAVQVLAEIEKSTGQNLPVATFFEAPTIEELSRKLHSTPTADHRTCLIPVQAKGSAVPIFFIPPLAVTILTVRELVGHLGPDQPFYGIQPKGIDHDEAPHNRVETMASHYLEEIRQVQPKGPYVLVGQCFGGHVAYEMAHQLCQKGESVAFLGIIDSLRPPGFYHQVKRQYAEKSGKDVSKLKLLLPDDRQSFASFAPDHLRHRISRAEKAHFEAMEFYNPTHIFQGKITFLWAENATEQQKRERLQWKKLSEIEPQIHIIPGSHSTLLQEPGVRQLAGKLKACLKNADMLNTFSG